MRPPLDDARPLPEVALRRFREDGHVVWRGGSEPGELAAGPKNPVLWKRGA